MKWNLVHWNKKKWHWGINIEEKVSVLVSVSLTPSRMGAHGNVIRWMLKAFQDKQWVIHIPHSAAIKNCSKSPHRWHHYYFSSPFSNWYLHNTPVRETNNVCHLVCMYLQTAKSGYCNELWRRNLLAHSCIIALETLVFLQSGLSPWISNGWDSLRAYWKRQGPLNTPEYLLLSEK